MELGITGHLTRGDEVIKILETLGGVNRYNVTGCLNKYFYYISKNYKDIESTYIGPDEIKGYEIFSLDDFLKKFPYKVGDKVRIPEYESEVRIDKMYWDGYEIQYEVYTDEVETYSAEELNQWNESNNKSKTNEEDNYCETLEIKVLGYKVGDVVFANSAGWIRITNKLWDCYVKEHVYEGIGVLNEHKYDNIRHKDIITKMETDSVIENMKESITPSPHITANITEKNNCDIECPDMLDADKNLFHTTNEYEEIVEKSFQGGYEKCKSEMNMNDNNVDLTLKISTCYVLPDGYHFADENGNVIDVKKIQLVKNSPTYPKTYAECCKVIGYGGIISFAGLDDEEENLYRNFIVLKRFRDAYWKIAGEELGLDKPWKPVWDGSEDLYTIHTFNGEIRLSGTSHRNAILVFPTPEMREVFFDNFKDLIEKCKELL